MRLRWFAVISLAALACAETRPRYGGALRVETREAVDTADPPQSGPGLGDLNGAFNITRWEAGRRAVFQADENASGGRPFVDSVDVQMAPANRDRAIELGRADIVEIAPSEVRRVGPTWSSSPVTLLALVFGPRVEDARVRQALALAVDRAAIQKVLLQGQGEVAGGLLPQWISGYAFLFPANRNVAEAKALLATVPAAARALTLAADDRAMADRIAINARDAGIAITIVQGAADVRLLRARILSTDGASALGGIAAVLGLPNPPRADTPEALYTAERSLLEGGRVIPLAHLPDLYAVGPRVRGGPGITPLGEWRFENLWLDDRPPAKLGLGSASPGNRPTVGRAIASASPVRERSSLCTVTGVRPILATPFQPLTPQAPFSSQTACYTFPVNAAAHYPTKLASFRQFSSFPQLASFRKNPAPPRTARSAQ